MLDKDLIQKVQQGDSGAFATLMQRYESPIKNSMFNILGDADSTADITQEAFITTFEKIHRYNPDYRYFSWVYRIAFNKALNRINHRKHREPYLDENMESLEPGPHAKVETRERDYLIHQAMATLVFKYRILLILRHFLDYSYSEIASVTDLPVSTVRSRLHTARVMMKKELKRIGIPKA
ncbi:MAG: sigma-70 family RNA polymerase sigma factor [bacterium]|nr:sigma-70 family RNA polymerase sigma factor [bacterium]